VYATREKMDIYPENIYKNTVVSHHKKRNEKDVINIVQRQKKKSKKKENNTVLQIHFKALLTKENFFLKNKQLKKHLKKNYLNNH